MSTATCLCSFVVADIFWDNGWMCLILQVLLKYIQTQNYHAIHLMGIPLSASSYICSNWMHKFFASVISSIQTIKTTLDEVCVPRPLPTNVIHLSSVSKSSNCLWDMDCVQMCLRQSIQPTLIQRCICFKHCINFVSKSYCVPFKFFAG